MSIRFVIELNVSMIHPSDCFFLLSLSLYLSREKLLLSILFETLNLIRKQICNSNISFGMRANRRINRTKIFKVTISSDRTLILRDAFESKIFDSVKRRKKKNIPIDIVHGIISYGEIYWNTFETPEQNPFFRKGVVDVKTGKGIGPEMKI